MHLTFFFFCTARKVRQGAPPLLLHLLSKKKREKKKKESAVMVAVCEVLFHGYPLFLVPILTSLSLSLCLLLWLWLPLFSLCAGIRCFAIPVKSLSSLLLLSFFFSD